MAINVSVNISKHADGHAQAHVQVLHMQQMHTCHVHPVSSTRIHTTHGIRISATTLQQWLPLLCSQIVENDAFNSDPQVACNHGLMRT